MMQVGDLLLMGMAFLVATWVYYAPNNDLLAFEEFLAVRTKIENFLVGIVMLGIWHLVCSALKLYESKRLSTITQEIPDIIKATSFVTLTTAGLALLFKVGMISPEFLLAFWILATLFMCLGRMGLRITLAWMRRRGRNSRNMIIIGTNPRALKFANEIRMKPELGYRLLGFVDEPWDGLNHQHLEGFPVISNLKTFPEFIRTFSVDEIVLALPLRSYYHQASQIVAQCEEQGIIVRMTGDLFSSKLAKSTIDEVGTHTTFTLNTGAIGDQAHLIKRTIDVIIALPSLIILSPFFAIIAFCIKFTSPGPIFFVQKRLGFNKRPFNLYKFRSMVTEAEALLPSLEHLNEATGAAFKIANDPRLTPIGKFLRKTSIDELPQLFNVLKGDMSLVGPRPIQVRDFEAFYQDWHRRRFSVRPGITCLWQVNGRNTLTFEQWMELDIEYIDKWTLWLDWKILLKTIPVVLWRTGAA
jgi:exopolysaccharide biosynthesis polyprenyl glycosylphosphotransferase